MSNTTDFTVTSGTSLWNGTQHTLTGYSGRDTHVVIPEGVTDVNSDVFRNNPLLVEITIPESVKRIQEEAFQGCTALERVVIQGEGLEYLGKACFRGCTALKEIRLPCSLIHIYADLFDGCTSLLRTEGPFTLAGDALLSCSASWSGTELKIPQGVRMIGGRMFYASEDTWNKNKNAGRITSIHIPEGVEYIGALAFSHLKSLQEINLPESLRVLGWGAMDMLGKLLQADLSHTALTVLEESMFASCRNLKEVLLPQALKRIGKQAFESCYALTALSLPEGLESIGEDAFNSCGLQKLVVPGSIVRIEKGAFGGCSDLKHLEIRGTPEMTNLFATSISIDKDYRGLLLLPDMVPGKISKSIRDLAVYSFCKVSLEGRDFREAAVKNYNAFLKRTRKAICADPSASMMQVRYLLREQLLEEEEIQTLLASPAVQRDADLLAAVQAYRVAPVSREEKQKKAEKQAKAKAKKDAQLLENQDYDSLPLSQRVKVKRKRNPQAKVELLEEAVLQGSMEDLENVYATCGDFEFTARALGYAARYRGAETVAFLLDHGASFDYKESGPMESKYRYKRPIGCHTETTVYYLYLLENYKPSPEPAGMTLLPPTDRTQILELLLKQNAIAPEYFYYSAAIYGDIPLLTACRQLGIEKMPAFAINRICEVWKDGLSIAYRDQVSYTLRDTPPQQLRPILEHLFSQLEGKTMQLLPLDLYREEDTKEGFLTHYCHGEVFDLMLEHTNLTKRISKRQLLYGLVEQSNAAGLARVFREGWCSKAKEVEDLFKFAQANDGISAETKALLMDQLNQLSPKAKKSEPSLSANPFSVAEMKKLWSYKKQKDGDLILTSYKGESVDVVIPSAIGKSTVTALDGDLFNPEMSQLSPTQKAARKNLRSVVIPDTITALPEMLFFGTWQTHLTCLEQVVLGKNIRTLGSRCFYECSALTEITLPDTLRSIEENAFYGSGIQRIVLPDSVKKLGGGVFDNCASLKEVVLPKDIQRIPVNTFKGSGLETIDIPESVTELAEGAFSGCRQLKQINIPQGITAIGKEVFSGCGFESLTLPAHISQLGVLAFAHCSALKDITFENPDIQIDPSAFIGCSGLADDRGLVILNHILYDYVNSDRTRPLAIPETVTSGLAAWLMQKLPYIVTYGAPAPAAPLPETRDLAIGSTLLFGRMPQKNWCAEPLRWILLARENGRVLVTTEQAIASIDIPKYSSLQNLLQSGTWDVSPIRQWLNGEFMNAVFTEEEQSRIAAVTLTNHGNIKSRKKGGAETTDRVFLLSMDEVEAYLPTQRLRRAPATAYTAFQMHGQASLGVWATRTPGNGKHKKPASVSVDGFTVNHEGNARAYYLLRPALWLREED